MRKIPASQLQPKMMVSAKPHQGIIRHVEERVETIETRGLFGGTDVMRIPYIRVTFTNGLVADLNPNTLVKVV